MTWTPRAGLHPLRAVRTFTLPHEGGSGSGYRLVAVRTDTYSCATCTFASSPEDQGVPVTVWRVTNPPTPWWITPEVHCCAAGPAELQVRATPAQVRPARQWRSPLRPWWIGLVASRSFVVADHRRRSVVNGIEIATDLDCDRCARPRSLTVYELDADVPVWLNAPDLRVVERGTRSV